MQKLLIGFATFAMGAALAASSYRVTLFQPSKLGSAELRAGDYKIEVKGDKAVVKDGKHVVEADVKVESSDRKYSATTVRYLEGGKIQEIHLGGTTTKLVFAN